MIIREAQPSDWEAFLSLYGGDPPTSPEAALGRFRRKLASELECVLVAEEHRPGAEPRLVGRALFGGIVAWAKSRNATWLEWYASPSAVPFYTRLGFTGTLCPDPEYPYYEIRFGAEDD